MTWKQLLDIIIESPLYFTMSVKDRKVYIIDFLAMYQAKFC